MAKTSPETHRSMAIANFVLVGIFALLAVFVQRATYLWLFAFVFAIQGCHRFWESSRDPKG